MVKPLLESAKCTILEAEFNTAKTCVANFSGDDKLRMTTTKLISELCEALEALLIVHLALKLAVTYGTTTATCENSFFSQKHHARSQAIEEARAQSTSCPTCL